MGPTNLGVVWGPNLLWANVDASDPLAALSVTVNSGRKVPYSECFSMLQSEPYCRLSDFSLRTAV